MSKRTTVLACIAALVLTATAYAGNGGGPNKSSLGLVMVSSATSSSSSGPRYGDKITFAVSTTATDRPFVRLACSQNGAVVYGASAGFFADYLSPWEQNFTLSSDYWTGGAADCTATLYYYDGKRFRDLASLSFPVSA
jgi:hypothetical protein